MYVTNPEQLRIVMQMKNGGTMKNIAKNIALTITITAVLIAGLVFASNVAETMDSVIALESSKSSIISM